MGLGSTAKKLQRLSDLAETLYRQVEEVLERLSALQQRLEGASDDIEAVRREQREQRAILEALADEQGVDVDAVLEAVDVEPETTIGEQTGRDGDGTADADAGEPADAA